DPSPIPAATADLAVAGAVRLLRGEGADVAGSYLAAGCACRGADGGLCHARGRAFENGRLRVLALFAADASARQRSIYAADLHLKRGGGHLHILRGIGPGGHEETHRLFFG